MAESKQYYIGVDVGGTSVKLGLFDEEGDLLGKTSVPTPSLACGEGHAAVIGGIGNLYGAMLGGLVLGLLESFGTSFFGGQWRDVFAFGFLILFLVFKPTGILGERVVERV